MRPVFFVVGGPSGSGKSSFGLAARAGFDFFNVDDYIAEKLNQGRYQGMTDEMRRAGLDACAAFLRERFGLGRNVSTEVSLRRIETLDQAREARAAGFTTALKFIGVSLSDALANVADRVRGGGHGANVAKLRAIHEGSLANLRAAIEVFDHVLVFENRRVPGIVPTLERVLITRAGRPVWVREGTVPEWLQGCLPAELLRVPSRTTRLPLPSRLSALLPGGPGGRER